MVTLLCVSCASSEDFFVGGDPLRAALAVEDGTSVCERHADASRERTGSTATGPGPCAACRAGGHPHPAWFVLDGTPLCIRHAADEVFPEDDMAAHFMAHGLYLRLHALDVHDAY